MSVIGSDGQQILVKHGSNYIKVVTKLQLQVYLRQAAKRSPLNSPKVRSLIS